MPSVFAVYMWYAVNKLVYMTAYVLEIELVSSFSVAYHCFFLYFCILFEISKLYSFILIKLSKLTKLKILIPRSSFNVYDTLFQHDEIAAGPMLSTGSVTW